MRKIFQSFAARITFYILTLVFVIFCCIAVVFSSYSRQREQQQAIQYTAALQQNVILKIETKLTEVETALTIAEGQVYDLTQSPDSIIDVAARVMRNNSLLKGVGIAFRPGFYPAKDSLFIEYVYREHGNKFLYKHYGNGMGDYTSRRWFIKIMGGSKGYWTEAYTDNDTKDDIIVSYVMPCTDNKGMVYGAIIADVSLNDLTASLRSMRPYKNSYSFILDKNGKYVSHPVKELILATNYNVRAKLVECPEIDSVGKRMVAGEYGSARTNIEGKDVLLCYAPVKRTGWSVCSVNLYTDVMKNLGSATFTILIILIIGMLMLFISIRLLVAYTSKPMRTLADAAYQIARGNFNAELPLVETKDDMKMLHDAFANMQSSLRSYIDELQNTTRAKERIESELTIAHNIQMSLVPKIFSPFPDCEQLELFACLEPAKEVGGDFYDFFIRNDKLFYVIGDVSGKGIPASLVMAITRTLFRIISSSCESPAEIVSKLNDAIAKDNPTNMFVTMFAGVLDLNSGSMQFCNAGHNPPLVATSDCNVSFMQVEQNLPLGVIEGFGYTEQSFSLASGDAVLLYTDGLTEAENEDKQLYGEERLITTMKVAADKDAHGIIYELKDKLSQYVGNAEQSDDLTLLCFRLNKSMSSDGNKEKTHNSKMTLTLNNNICESEKLYPFILQFSKTAGINEATLSSINLAVEEALVNSIMYAYPDGTTGLVTLTAEWDKEENVATFILKDKGIAFNPLSVPEADTTSDIDERNIGGLGIFLVKELMDDVNYKRVDNENILTMTKIIKEP